MSETRPLSAPEIAMIRAMPPHHQQKWARTHVAEILATLRLIEGSDPASPEPPVDPACSEPDCVDPEPHVEGTHSWALGSDPASPESLTVDMDEAPDVGRIADALMDYGFYTERGMAPPMTADRLPGVLYDAGLRATPPAGSTIPDSPLDEAALEAAIGDTLELFGAAITNDSGRLSWWVFASELAPRYAARLAEAPVTGEGQ